MNELIVRWKNGETAIYRFTTKGDAVTAKMIFENHCGDRIKDIKINALEQQPKTGHWIETSEGTVCSECGKYPYDDGEYHIANWSSDFCPNCGAEMEVEE